MVSQPTPPPGWGGGGWPRLMCKGFIQCFNLAKKNNIYCQQLYLCKGSGGKEKLLPHRFPTVGIIQKFCQAPTQLPPETSPPWWAVNGHCGATVQYRRHCPMQHIQGHTRCPWKPPSGNYLLCIAPAAARATECQQQGRNPFVKSWWESQRKRKM